MLSSSVDSLKEVRTYGTRIKLELLLNFTISRTSTRAPTQPLWNHCPKASQERWNKVCESVQNVLQTNIQCKFHLHSADETKDEPYAWEAREFLRKKLVGKEVVFTVEYKVPSTGREYGFLYLGKGIEMW